MQRQIADEACADIGMQELIGLGVVIIVLGFVVTLGVQMQSDVRTDIGDTCPSGFTRNTTNAVTASDACITTTVTNPLPSGQNVSAISSIEGYTAGTDSINATGKLASKQGLIVTAVVGIFLIGLFLLYLRFK